MKKEPTSAVLIFAAAAAGGLVGNLLGLTTLEIIPVAAICGVSGELGGKFLLRKAFPSGRPRLSNITLGPR